MESSVEFATKCIQNNYKHVLEFGVYKGDTIQKLRNSLDESYKIFGFDSFEGLPEDWIGTPCFKDVMREHNAVYGGEMSAHHYFRNIGSRI
jgi:hypothetical protein